MPFVVQLRGSTVEARHAFSAVCVDAAGEVQDRVGEDLRTTWRSAAKPFQLEVSLGVLPRDAVDTLEGPSLALGTASHHAEPGHVGGVQRILERWGCAESDLRCGAHEPLNPAAVRALILEGREASSIHNNCSGKHAFMAAACRAQGWPSDYRDSDHPLQLRILRNVQRRSGVEAVDRVIDGCGVPCFVLPLTGMARAWAQVAEAAAAGGSLLGRIGRALVEHPWYASGTGAVDGELVRRTGGAVMAKVGAEGLLCLGLPSRGLGAAIKVHSGSPLAREIAVRWVLQRWRDLGWPDSALPVDEEVRNCVGTLCGSVSVEG
jgi:L-asparaginase II